MARVAVYLRISGLVHGVRFRASMVEVASNAGVAGWVKNIPDGSVDAILEGEEDDVWRVIRWAEKGPPRARVDSVKVEKLPVRHLRGFRIEG